MFSAISNNTKFLDFSTKFIYDNVMDELNLDDEKISFDYDLKHISKELVSRDDILQKALQHGVSRYDDAEMIKLALCYVFPRRTDYCELADLLLDTFGSFQKVLEASVKDLRKIVVLNDENKRSLALFKQIGEYYYFIRALDKTKLDNTQKLVNYFIDLLILKQKEFFYIIGLNNDYELLCLKKLAEGIESQVFVSKEALEDFCLDNPRVKHIVVAHNHPFATCEPSREDDISTNKIKNWAEEISIDFIDHIIVGVDGAFSFKEVEFFNYK